MHEKMFKISVFNPLPNNQPFIKIAKSNKRVVHDCPIAMSALAAVAHIAGGPRYEQRISRKCVSRALTQTPLNILYM